MRRGGSGSRWRQKDKTAMHRAWASIAISALAILAFTGCATNSGHPFNDPTADWQARNGQLLYRNATTTLIGEVFVRFSKKTGDFELNFSKGPVGMLLAIRQDSAFARVTGALARRGWSGKVDHAPPQLRGWLELRAKFFGTEVAQKSHVTLRHNKETWVFHF
ncbi:MAG: hypothetical protein QOH39_1901 [Verrucomicrobiota bacterium]|jgi:hypothetical protein